MKHSINLFMLTLALLGASVHSAEAALPSLPEIQEEGPSLGTQVGRVLVFPSLGGESWSLVGSFNPSLSCTSGTASRGALCELKVQYLMNESDTGLAREFEQVQRTELRYLNSLDSSVIERFEGSFKGLPEGIAIQGRNVMNRLLFDRSIPHAQLSFRVDSKERSSILSRFESEGLGAFEQSVVIHAQKTGDLLALRNVAPLRELLAERDSFARGSLLKALGSAVDSAIIQSHHFTYEEARAQAIRMLRLNYFKLNAKGRYVGLPEKLPADIQSLTLIQELSEPVAVNCTIQVVLKKDAQPEFRCEEVDHARQ